MQTDWTRRLLLAGLAGAPLAACATPGPSRRPVEVQVNLTNSALPPPPPGAEPAESDGAVRTGFDAVRRMTIQAMINGAGPYRFVVDTGANRSVLSSEVVEALGLQTSGQAMVHGIAGVLPSSTVLVASLTVSGLVSRKVRMPVLPRRFLGADGLLGVDVLARRSAKLDFEGQSFSITAPVIDRAKLARGGASVATSGPNPDAIVVPARHRFGQLTIVDAELGGVALTAFLDSGAEITVGNSALKAAVLSRTGLAAGGLTRVELVSATGQLVDGELATVPPLRLGGVRLGNLSCVFADLHTFTIWDLTDRPALLIGVDVMRHFDSIELDFAKSNVTFRSKLFGRSVNAGS